MACPCRGLVMRQASQCVYVNLVRPEDVSSHHQTRWAGRGFRRALVCDFDGTITDMDTGRLVLTRFSDGDWMRYHEQYVRGEFSFEECLRRQYSHVTQATRASILSLVDEQVQIRRGFEELLTAAARAEVPVAIASYGLDFCIEHVLHRVHGRESVQVSSPKAKLDGGAITLAFPSARTRGVTNLKEDAVCWYKQKGFLVLFVGDGASDLPAAEKAGVCFAMEGSELAGMCEQKGIKYIAIKDFWPVVRALTRGTPR